MTRSHRAARLGLAALLLAGGCAPRYTQLAPPRGATALGLEFGVDRAAVERTLRAGKIGFQPAQGEGDVLVAERCEGGPVRGPCRLLLGVRGLYAVEQVAPAAEAGALAQAVSAVMGKPDRLGDAHPGEGGAGLVAAWDRPGWTVTVRRGGGPGDAQAVCRVEYEPATPPVVAGVPLGRLRDDVERALEGQGATLVERDAGRTHYVGAPRGPSDVVSCVVHYRGGRAAAVTELHTRAPDDAAALARWRILAKRFEVDLGRAPATSCAQDGPDRAAGDCTATWSSDRLVVVVGAHRVAGAQHRGSISVYTAYTYPPLAGAGDAAGDAEEAEAR
jgi:hypothetical protein